MKIKNNLYKHCVVVFYYPSCRSIYLQLTDICSFLGLTQNFGGWLLSSPGASVRPSVLPPLLALTFFRSTNLICIISRPLGPTNEQNVQFQVGIYHEQFQLDPIQNDRPGATFDFTQIISSIRRSGTRMWRSGTRMGRSGTYIPSSPHAYPIYNTLIFSTIKIVNNI